MRAAQSQCPLRRLPTGAIVAAVSFPSAEELEPQGDFEPNLCTFQFVADIVIAAAVVVVVDSVATAPLPRRSLAASSPCRPVLHHSSSAFSFVAELAWLEATVAIAERLRAKKRALLVDRFVAPYRSKEVPDEACPKTSSEWFFLASNTFAQEGVSPRDRPA